MQLDAEELQLFKRPLGILLKNNEINKDSLLQYVNGKMIISVGDATTDKLLELGVVPSIQIVDGRERRAERDFPLEKYAKIIKCSNPPGTIADEAIKAFKDALASPKPVRIAVNGEEDLIGMVAIALAPENSIIFYGQPLEGLVVVDVSAQMTGKLKDIIEKIKAQHI